MPKNLDKKTLLEQIRADILSDNVCPDLAQTATQLVMGHGNQDAKIVFIGEAPGKQEDLQGVPFIGAAGKLLDELLASISLERKDVYITNIVKYRPPNNRDPSQDEKYQFWSYLLRELKVINPKYIVTLGRHSMGYFLPDVFITDVHGKVFEVKMSRDVMNITPHKADDSGLSKEQNFVTMKLIPLYHPAAALYNGSLRQTLFNDFKIIKNLKI